MSGGDIYETPAKLTNLNPPLLTVLLAPTALLDALTGYRIFAALTLLLVVGAIVAVTRELRSWRVSTAVVLVVLASSPLHGTLVLGQIYGLLLVGLTAGWIAERRGRPLLAAAFYGVTVAPAAAGPAAAAPARDPALASPAPPVWRRRRSRRCSGCSSRARAPGWSGCGSG